MAIRSSCLHRGAHAATVACTALVLLVATPRQAHADTAWVERAVAGPPIANSQMESAACATSTDCTAVGSYSAPGRHTKALAAHWSGISWTTFEVPVPARVDSSILHFVSCSDGGCLAVGSYMTATGVSRPLAEDWDGTTWTNVDPTGSGQPVTLLGVSCSSASLCMAVGRTAAIGAASHEFAERWASGTWTVTPVPESGNPSYAGLEAVSCVNASYCLAVGSAFYSPVLRAAAARWDGTGWAPADPPQPAHTDLHAVSCPAVDACIAVGAHSASRRTLAEYYDGAAWSLLTTADPSSRSNDSLLGVSCSSPTQCVAVGTSLSTPMAETWDGTSWTLSSPQSFPASGRSGFAGVTCGSDGWCLGVGFGVVPSGVTHGLAETWSDGAWTLVPSPDRDGTSFAELTSVSCPSATSCTAVGQYAPSVGTLRPLVESLIGRQWQVESTPLVRSQVQALESVSCLPTSFCAAVGVRGSGAGLAEIRSSNGWQITPVPDTTGSTDTHLTAVSCTAPDGCVAVGYLLDNTHGYLPDTEIWNGTSWTQQLPPLPSDAEFVGDSRLQSASCITPTSCFAAGYYRTTARTDAPLIERWNGTAWTAHRIPGPAQSQLFGLSCTGPSTCLAVGNTYDSAQGRTLPIADARTATTWAAIPAPGAPAGEDAYTEGVACTSVSACTAVGVDTGGTEQIPAAAAWDGTTWTTQTIPNTYRSAFLAGLACSGQTCRAVGSAKIDGLTVPVTYVRTA